MLNDALLPLLPSLVALVEEGSVTRAARRIGISQPRMSGRLAELRRLLGDPVLVSSSRKRGLLATERAIELARAAKSSLMELENTFVRTGFDPSVSDRTFRIMANENAAVMVGTPLVQAIRAIAGADVRVALFAFDKSRIDELESGEFDLILGRPHQLSNKPSLVTRIVVRDSFLTVMRNEAGGSSIDLDTFCKRDHILISTNPALLEGTVDQELSKLGRRRNIVVSVQSHLLAAELIAATDLIATLPRALLIHRAPQLSLLKPPLDFEPFVVTAAWHPRTASDPAHRWLRSLLFSLNGSARADPFDEPRTELLAPGCP